MRGCRPIGRRAHAVADDQEILVRCRAGPGDGTESKYLSPHPSSSINSQKLAMAIGSWMATSEIQLGPARRYIGEIAIQRE
jgi:hypothetical protein